MKGPLQLLLLASGMLYLSQKEKHVLTAFIVTDTCTNMYSPLRITGLQLPRHGNNHKQIEMCLKITVILVPMKN